MKIRHGFVSNSSSSSFSIYGASFDNEKLKELLKTGGNEYALCDILDEMCTKEGLEYYMPCDYSTSYIGKSFSAIEDNETGKEFKDKVEKAIKKLIGHKVECSKKKLAWRDG